MAKQDLHFSITASNDDLKRKLAESRQAILDSAKTAEDQASRIDGSFKRMALSAAAGFSAISFGKSVIRVRGEIQMMEASFEVLLGSKAKANKMIAEIKQLAIDSPLEMPQVSGAVQTLLGYGIAADKVMGIVGQLSDVSKGNADQFRALSLAYAQVQSTGKLMGQDLLQMISAGFNPLKVISEQTGKSVGQLKEEMAGGAISAEMVAAAFDKVTSAGGMFYQMTQKQAEGIVGVQATFEDAITNQMNKFGEKNEELIIGGYRFATSVVENADTIVAALVPIITTYGAYKASIIAVNAIGKVKESSFAAVEIAELSKLLPLKAQEANADITAAVGKGHLSQATAERLLAVRAEVQAELEGLRVKAQTLAQEAVAAAQTHKNALQRSVAARQNMALAQSQMQIAIQGGNAEEIAAAKTAARTAKLEVNSSAIAVNTTRQALGTAQINAAATATAVDTMQTNLNTVATRSATTAKTLWTAATMRLTKAFHSLKLAFASNPIGMILTGVTMAISLFSMFGDKIGSVADKSKALAASIEGGVNKALADETAKLQSLRRQLSETEPSSKKRIDLIKELKREYPDIIGNIDAESAALDKVIGSIDNYISKLKDKIRLQVLEQKYFQNIKDVEDAKISLATGGDRDDYDKVTKRVRLENALILDQLEYQQNLVKYSKEYADLQKEKKSFGDVEVVSMLPRNPESKIDYENKAKAFEDAAKREGKPFGKLEPYEEYLKRFEKNLVETDEKATRLQIINNRIAEIEKETPMIAGGGGGTSGQASKAAKDYKAEEIAERLELERMKIDLLKDGREKELKQIEQTKNEKIAAIQKEQNEIAAEIAKGGLTKEQKAAKTERSVVLEEQKGLVNQQATQDSTAVNDKYNKEIAQKEKELTDVTLSEVQRRNDALKTKYDEMREWSDKTFAKGSEEHKAFNVKIGTAEAKEQLDILTAEYQTYAEKRTRIEEKFNTDIAAMQAKNADGSLDRNIKAAQKQRDEAVKGVNFDEAKEGADLSKLFGNLDNLTLPSMKELRDKIKAWIDSAGKDMKSEDLKAVSDAFNNLDLKIADRDPFAVMKTAAVDYKNSVTAVKEAQEAYNKSLAENGEESETTKSAEEALMAVQNARAAAVAKSTESLQSAAQKGAKIVGVAKDIMGILGDLGIEVPEQIAGTIDGLGQMFDGLASINLAEPLSIISGAVKAVGGLVKAVASLFNGDNDRQRDIERWRQSIDALEKQYDTLGDAIEKAYSQNASDLLDTQNELLEKQKILIEQQKQAERSKKDPDDGALDAYDRQLDEINKKIEDNKIKAEDAIFGADLKSAIDDFASAYFGAWDAGEDRAKAQKDVVKRMIQGMIQEIIKSNITQKVADLRAALKDAILDGIIDETEQAAIDKLQEEIYAQSEKDAKSYEKWLKGDDDKNNKSLAGQIRGSVATEASVLELGGLFRSQTDSLLRIDKKLDIGMGRLIELARSNAAIEMNTARTAANTAQTVATLAQGFSSMQGELRAINKNTSKDTGNYGN